MNRDFVGMLSAPSESGAELLVVGAPAVSVHAEPRATGRAKGLADLVFGEPLPGGRVTTAE